MSYSRLSATMAIVALVSFMVIFNYGLATVRNLNANVLYCG